MISISIVISISISMRAHRRMMNDRVGDMLRVLGARQRAHRATLLTVPERVLERKLGSSHALIWS